MSKLDFAEFIGVAPSRISQYIAAGIIGRDAQDLPRHGQALVTERFRSAADRAGR